MKQFGIVLPGHKTVSECRTLPAPRRVVLPLRQHIGAECVPLVTVGERVKMGQKIAESADSCIHASVAGVVEDIAPHRVTSGETVLSIAIKNDFTDARELIDSRDPLAAVRAAGIVGMGGAAFPTAVKLDAAVDTLIVNGCECEPYLTADACLMRTDAVFSGMRIAAQLLHARRAVLAVEDAVGMRRAAGEVIVLPRRYPQGAEKQLIFSVTGREVPTGKLPRDVGCAVLNAATCAAIERAVTEKMPLIERIVSVAGEGVRYSQNLRVRIGTSFAEVLRAAGGVLANARVIAGGPMMGTLQTSLDVPVVKGTNGIVCLLPEKDREQTACIRCGKCAEVCPMRLQPLYLYRARQDGAALARLGLFDCIACGCCSYVCPARLPLAEQFRSSKKEWRGRL